MNDLMRLICQLYERPDPIVIEEAEGELDLPAAWLDVLEKDVPELKDRIQSNGVKVWLVKDDLPTDGPKPEDLHRLYWDEGKTLGEIGDLYGYSSGGMRHVFNRFGIPRRGRGRPMKSEEEE